MPDDASSSPRELTDVLRQLLGAENVIDAPEQRELMSQDIWSKGETASFIARPESVEELCETVKAAHARGIALNPRGGGMSYTNGYTPDRPDVGILDFTGLDKIVEINTEDMYVTVQAGCTWKTLYEALEKQGVRTPFWGPLSGISSTVGGGLAQNNAFFGAGVYGTTGDSVTGVSVVLADGSLVRTGSQGSKGTKPFWRYYGPDLTGLFLGDGGALGHKAEVTFRLIPLPEHEAYASFEFGSREECSQAMAEVMRQNIASEVFGFDPNLQRVRMKRASLSSDVKTLGNVIKGQNSLFKGLVEGAKVAFAGRQFFDDAAHSLHIVVEGRSQAGVTENTAFLKSICKRHGGNEIENSIPKIIRANPFNPLNNMLGPEGERWVPVHGIVPVSEGPGTWADLEALFESMSSEFERHGVQTGYLITSLATTGYLIEPVFLWPEELFPIHETSIEQDWLHKLPRHEANPEATEVIARARKAVIDVFTAHGGVHFQIGRAYPYSENREESALELLKRVKRAVDTDSLVNPGCLGLD